MIRVLALAALLAAITLAAPAVDATSRPMKKAEVLVAAPKAPPALPLLRMMEADALGEDAAIRLAVWITPEQLIAMVQDGKHRLAALPLTVAAKLRNKGVDIQLLNVNTWGVASLVSAEAAVDGWNDLSGQSLFVPLKSSTPDALTRYFLSRAGLRPERDLQLHYAPVIEIAQLFKAGRVRNAVLIEPYVTSVTTDVPGAREVLSFADAWKETGHARHRIPNAAMAVIAPIPEEAELYARFNREYEKALAWTVENPAEAALLAEKHLGMRAGLIAPAIPGLGLHYEKASEASGEIEDFFRVLRDFSPDLIGKTIPDATFYWE